MTDKGKEGKLKESKFSMKIAFFFSYNICPIKFIQF